MHAGPTRTTVNNTSPRRLKRRFDKRALGRDVEEHKRLVVGGNQSDAEHQHRITAVDLIL